MELDEWFYYSGNEAVGPLSEKKIISLVHDRIIGFDTLVWRVGQEDWKSIREALPHSLKVIPPLPNIYDRTPQAINSVRNDDGNEINRLSVNDAVYFKSPVPADAFPTWEQTPPRPWRRYCARIFDVTINGFIGIFTLYFVFAAAGSQLDSKLLDNQIISTMACILFAIPINALLIGLTGSTLGKWFFGIKILNSEGACIGFIKALKRELLIWTYGFGFGIPIVSLLTLGNSYFSLTRNGIASWDESLSTKIIYRPYGSRQIVSVIIAILVYVCVIAALISL